MASRSWWTCQSAEYFLAVVGSCSNNANRAKYAQISCANRITWKWTLHDMLKSLLSHWRAQISSWRAPRRPGAWLPCPVGSPSHYKPWFVSACPGHDKSIGCAGPKVQSVQYLPCNCCPAGNLAWFVNNFQLKQEFHERSYCCLFAGKQATSRSRIVLWTYPNLLENWIQLTE